MGKIDLYFSSQAKALFQAYKASSVMDKRVVGEDREVLLKEFLKNHLSEDVKIGLRGQIIDSNGSSSGEADLIIYSFLGPKFGDLSFYFAETVLFIIEVKSFLNEKRLTKALEQVSKVKELRRKYSSGSIARGALTQKIPCGIFAFDTSLSIQTTKKLIKNYYSNVTDVEDKVEWICVLNSFLIANNEKGDWKEIDKTTKNSVDAYKGLLTVRRGYSSLFPMLIALFNEITCVVAATLDLKEYIIKKV